MSGIEKIVRNTALAFIGLILFRDFCTIKNKHMKKILLAGAMLLAFCTAAIAQTVEPNDSKTKVKAKKAEHSVKQGYKHTRHDVKKGYKNTKSDVKAGVEAGKENKENR